MLGDSTSSEMGEWDERENSYPKIAKLVYNLKKHVYDTYNYSY